MVYMLLSAALSAILMLILMPKFLPYLRKMKFGQTIYDLGPKAHLAKQGTPNMGGILIGGLTVMVTLVMNIGIGAWQFDQGLLAFLFCSLGSMAIGFADDYIKDVKKRHEGLTPKQKIMGQVVVGLLFSWYCCKFVGSGIALPFTTIEWDLGLWYIPLMTLVFIFMTNSANLQDGVDGLLSSVTVVGMPAWGMLSLFLAGKTETGISYPMVGIMTFALIGACAGFLRYNKHPALIFMGDTGSMFIGGVTIGAAMLLKMEFPMILIAFTMIMSSLSVIIQRVYFKVTHGKRLFKMSPIHHHFELCGMTENQIVMMYSAVTLVLSVLAVLSVSMRF